MKYECIFVGKVPPPKIDERDIQISDAQCFLENDIKKWKCNLCPKIYSTKQNLRIHVLDHSTDRPKPHSCEECGKAFKQHAHLSTHMLCHRKIKPHTCKVCAKSFTQVGKCVIDSLSFHYLAKRIHVHHFLWLYHFGVALWNPIINVNVQYAQVH